MESFLLKFSNVLCYIINKCISKYGYSGIILDKNEAAFFAKDENNIGLALPKLLCKDSEAEVPEAIQYVSACFCGFNDKGFHDYVLEFLENSRESKE